MGGFFPSFMADECLKHADAVNIGEGEPTWPLILEDARRGALKPKYHGGHSFDLARMPIPRREIFYGVETYDWDEDLVQVTRGCSYACHMCAIPAHMGNRIRFRPIEKVVEEVRGLKHENVYLADDSLFFPQRRPREYAEALFRALEPLGKKYFVSSTMALNVDPAFLDLAARAGMRNFYCTMNVDPVSIKALQGEPRERQVLVDLVRAVEDRGARFFASCAIGRDWDGPRHRPSACSICSTPPASAPPSSSCSPPIPGRRSGTASSARGASSTGPGRTTTAPTSSPGRST